MSLIIRVGEPDWDHHIVLLLICLGRIRADDFFRAMAQARANHTAQKTFRSFLAPDLLILDDLGSIA